MKQHNWNDKFLNGQKENEKYYNSIKQGDKKLLRWGGVGISLYAFTQGLKEFRLYN